MITCIAGAKQGGDQRCKETSKLTNVAGSRRPYSEPLLALIIMCMHRSMSPLNLPGIFVIDLQPVFTSRISHHSDFWRTLGDVGPSIMSLASSRSWHLNAIDVGRLCASFEEGSKPRRKWIFVGGRLHSGVFSSASRKCPDIGSGWYSGRS